MKSVLTFDVDCFLRQVDKSVLLEFVHNVLGYETVKKKNFTPPDSRFRDGYVMCIDIAAKPEGKSK